MILKQLADKIEQLCSEGDLMRNSSIRDFENQDCTVSDIYYDSEQDEIFIKFE